MHDPRSTIESGENEHENNVMLNKMHRRRNFQRQACVISVMAAFVIGLSLGVFVPVIGLGTAISSEFNDRQLLSSRSLSNFEINHFNTNQNNNNHNHNHNHNQNAIHSPNNLNNNVEQSNQLPDLRFPTIYDIQNSDNDKFRETYAVTFVSDEHRNDVSNTIKHVSSSSSISGTNKNDFDSTAVNFDRIIDSNDHLLTGYLTREKTRKITSNRLADGKHALHPNNKQQPQPTFFPNSLKRLNKNNNKKYVQFDYANESKELNELNELLADSKQNQQLSTATAAAAAAATATVDNGNPSNQNENPFDVIDDDIFWGKIIENALPMGFSIDHVNDWTNYVKQNAIVKLEIGCGRMQNRLVTFEDGRKACARYRQNTDQIQGELFSFYLGRLLNLTNLAPSAASIIDLNGGAWLTAAQDIQTAQWKSQRPVVLTDWIDNLEAANIPALFQPMERHLNKYDVKNITLGLDVKPQKSLLHTLGGIKQNPNWNQLPVAAHLFDMEMNKTVKQKLVELAQWSDLIIFDYLIANLDRVVNNLYNFQWNADIMTAPAHNLARQSDSQLLVFLDNESGLLHGYRLLKKYETYHGLLLDNLCVFRRPTIVALQQLQHDGIGKRLQQLFEQSTTDKVRDVLPSLPDKSIKILVDRIDRVLGQVQKCRELFQSR